MDLKLLVKLGDLPNGVEVRKVGGQKKHQVERSITIYDQAKGEHQRIHAKEGTVFLIGSLNGFIDAYPADKEVVWEADLESLVSLAQEKGEYEA